MKDDDIIIANKYDVRLWIPVRIKSRCNEFAWRKKEIKELLSKYDFIITAMYSMNIQHCNLKGMTEPSSKSAKSPSKLAGIPLFKWRIWMILDSNCSFVKLSSSSAWWWCSDSEWTFWYLTKCFGFNCCHFFFRLCLASCKNMVLFCRQFSEFWGHWNRRAHRHRVEQRPC